MDNAERYIQSMIDSVSRFFKNSYKEARSLKDESVFLPDIKTILSPTVNAAGTKQALNSFTNNAISMFFGQNQSIDPMLAKLYMIDIETGGLSRSAPILQLAIGRASEMQDLAKDSDIPLDRIKLQSIFPVALEQDAQRSFTKDASGTVTVTDPTWERSAKPILSKAEFSEKYGNWALDGSKDFGLEELYDEIEKVRSGEISYTPKVGPNKGIPLTGEEAVKAIGQDAIMADSVSVGKAAPRMTTRAMIESLVLDLVSMKEKGEILSAANINFESLRLGSGIAAFFPEEGIVQDDILKEASLGKSEKILNAFGKSGDQTITQSDIRSLFAASYESSYKSNILDENNLQYIAAKDRLLRQGKQEEIYKLWGTYLKSLNTGKGIVNFDMQEATRIMFSSLQKAGLAEKSKDIYTGTNIDFLSRFILGETEQHLAHTDTRQQLLLTKRIMYGADKAYSLASTESPVRRFLSGANLYLDLLSGDRRVSDTMAVGALRDYRTIIDYGDKIYAGTVTEILKRRSVERSMYIMDQTLLALTQPEKSKFTIETLVDEDGKKYYQSKDELFTVTGTDTRRVNWTDTEGRRYVQYKVGGVDRTLLETSQENYKQLIDQGLSHEEAYDNIRKDVMSRYSRSQAVKDTAFSNMDTLEDLYHSSQIGNAAEMLSGDKGFKEALYERITPRFSMIKENFAEDFKSKFLSENKKLLIGGGIVGAAGALLLGAGVVSSIGRMYGDIVGTGDFDSTATILAEDGDKDYRDQIIIGDPNTMSYKLQQMLEPVKNSNFITGGLHSSMTQGFYDEAGYRNLNKDRIYVTDGDTATIERSRGGLKGYSTIRITGMDTPETNKAEIWKPGGDEGQPGARRAIYGLVNQMKRLDNISIQTEVGEETYGRSVGYFQGFTNRGEYKNVSKEMIESGFAASLVMNQDRYDMHSAAYRAAEKIATTNQLGIWRYKEYAQYKNQSFAKRKTFNVIFKNQQERNFQDPVKTLLLDEERRNIPGDHRNYNSISGMQETGMGVTLRRQMTDFGSPWKGPARAISQISEIMEDARKKSINFKERNKIEEIIPKRSIKETEELPEPLMESSVSEVQVFSSLKEAYNNSDSSSIGKKIARKQIMAHSQIDAAKKLFQNNAGRNRRRAT